MRLPDKVYDILKWVMFLATPITVFVTGLIEAIKTGDPVAIITAVIGGLGTLAGAILKISDVEYRKGIGGEDNG